MSTEEYVEQISLREHVGSLLGELSEREQVVVKMRYGFFGDRVHTLEEVGRVVNLSRERVRQIEAEVLKKLRRSQGIEGLDVYLD